MQLTSGRLETGAFTTHDGLRLYTLKAHAEEPKGSVLLIHGYAEHSGRYSQVINALVGGGYSVFAFDLRGHGQSEGERAYVAVFREFTADAAAFAEHIRPEQPPGGRYVLGHSMGGLVALGLALEHSEKLDGLIVSGPYLQNAVKTPAPLLWVAKMLSRLSPHLPVQALEAADVSSDPAIVSAYKSDPLVYHGKVKARLGTEMLAAGPYVLARAGDLKLPLLILHGTDDKLADVAASRRLYAEAGSSDKVLQIYEGFYHEVLNEPEGSRVVQDMLHWLDAHSKGVN